MTVRWRLLSPSLLLSASSLLVLSLWGQVPAHAQTAAAPGPKKPGTVRIGLVLPNNGLSGQGNPQDGAAIRDAEAMLLTGPTVESVKLQALLPDQAMAEAKQLNCDYILNASLNQQKVESGGRFGKLMNMRALQAASSAAVFMPGSNSSAKQIGMMEGQAIQQEMASAARGVKANNDVALQYTLTSVEGSVALSDTAKVRSKTDGENVVTPLVTEAANKILAVAKPVSAPAVAASATSGAAEGGRSVPALTTALRTYQNYDFVPGDKPVFVDDFSSTQEGEFPEKWELVKGQGAVNQQDGIPSFVVNSGDPARMKLRMTKESYLGKQFTLEFDTFGVDSQWGTSLYFNSNPSQDAPGVVLRNFKALYLSPNGEPLEGIYPDDISQKNYLGRWHHIAIAYKEPQIKVYVDQYRVLYVPDMKVAPQSISLGGEAAPDRPLAFRNVRLTTGGGANYVGKQFTEAKIVTHGINFDLDKATMRPESMGVLNQIAKLMSSDSSLKFEIDGHTDNSGTSPHNLELSNQRAEAVKSQLIAMGIDGSRLTTKGFGDSKPLQSNESPEGKADNRRVEFVRL